MLADNQTILAGGMLGACWALESLVPAIPHQRGLAGVRTRHVLLALLNAAPALLLAALLATIDGLATSHGLGLLHALEPALWVRVVGSLLVLDLSQYLCHVLMHKIPALWRTHAVHHHAEQMEATTAFRFHTLEIALNGLMLALVMLAIGIHVRELAIYNAILIPAGMFHHANIRIPTRLERLLSLLVVTPSLHRVHHSRWQPETDSNYSAVLSLWDRVFGTLRAVPDPRSIRVGLDGFAPEDTSTLRGILRTPFGKARATQGQPTEYQTNDPQGTRIRPDH